jgi:hypothetical protein
MAGTPFKAGPAFIVATSEDIAGVTPGSSLIYRLIRHIHVANTNASARTLSLWLGLTGAETSGTELIEGKSVAGADEYNMYWPAGLRVLSTDFLVGMSGSDGTSLVITVSGESYVV